MPWGVAIRNSLLNLCDKCGSYGKCPSHPKHKLMDFYKEQRLSSLWSSIVIIIYNLDERSEFVPGHTHILIVFDKVAMRQVSLRVLRVSPVNTISKCPTVNFTFKATLDRVTKGQGLGTFQQKYGSFWNREQLTALLPVLKDVMLLQLFSLNNDS